MRFLGAMVACVGVLAGVSGVMAADWRVPDADNTLIVDTRAGRMVVELRPDIAPLAVARIKTLTRRGFYDGLQFHRMIPDFVAQTGNPDNKDGGRSELPDLPPEFSFRMGADSPHVVVASPVGLSEGFIGSLPYVSNAEARAAVAKDAKVKAWGTYCAGVMGMGRGDAVNSANSELFFMLAAHPRLDRDYTVVGRVIVGEAVLGQIAVGEPPAVPDTMRTVRVMSDMPPDQRLQFEIMDTQGAAFAAHVKKIRKIRGADFSVCDVTVPVRVVTAR